MSSLLTPERHQIILETIQKHHTVKLKELVDQTGASESTIRRDLDQLEKERQIRRVHGGASLRSSTSDEPTLGEKTTKHHEEKIAIARYAASLIHDGDCVFIDAGSTTYEMIPFLKANDITVVTNGLNHLDALNEYQIKTYVLGGYVKHRTRAVVGTGALTNLQQYRFDQCFMGTNGISLESGYTTPDTEEAAVKQTTLSLSKQRYILADHSKFDEVAFCKFGNLDQADILTNYQGSLLKHYKEKTNIKVVTA